METGAEGAEAMSAEGQRRVLALVLTMAALVSFAVGGAIGATVEPWIGVAIGASGVVDLVVAALVRRGRIGPKGSARTAAETAEADPSYNPYARED